LARVDNAVRYTTTESKYGKTKTRVFFVRFCFAEYENLTRIFISFSVSRASELYPTKIYKAAKKSLLIVPMPRAIASKVPPRPQVQ
jgi:hypothetical protein